MEITNARQWLTRQPIEIFVCEYCCRRLIGVCNIPGVNNETGEKINNGQLLFYSSSGMNAEHRSVWPIAGVYDEKAGDDPMNTFITSFFEHPVCDGWIAKTHRDRNGLKSYFNSQGIKELCLFFEQVMKRNITDIKYTELEYDQWRQKANENIQTTMYINLTKHKRNHL